MVFLGSMMKTVRICYIGTDVVSVPLDPEEAVY